ncbi:hypothetical protein VE02_03885 [Pseudogymnoascus sp. 03VT05]|nr:hypothetical protein VE02_03885 [Pseudogymnoascus sp. 03VT05]
MSAKKDMRREDLIIPYQQPAPKEGSLGDIGNTLSSTVPMAAMFTRNKYIGWASVVIAVQNWLSESPDSKAAASQPAYMGVGMSYLPPNVPPSPTNPRSIDTPSLIQNHTLDNPTTKTPTQGYPGTLEFMSIENLKTFDPFAEADEDTGETKQSQNYIHIRIQQRNGRKTLTTVQGLPKKFDQKKILKVIKKKFACNGTIVTDNEMGEVIQLQGDQRKDVQEFLTDKKEGLELDVKTIKVHGF